MSTSLQQFNNEIMDITKEIKMETHWWVKYYIWKDLRNAALAFSLFLIIMPILWEPGMLRRLHWKVKTMTEVAHVHNVGGESRWIVGVCWLHFTIEVVLMLLHDSSCICWKLGIYQLTLQHGELCLQCCHLWVG